MNSLVQLSALIGSVLPLAIAAIQRESWSSAMKAVFAVAVCLIAATVTTLASGNFNSHDWFSSAVAVFTLTGVTYRSVWKPTGVADTVEAKTG